nr:hypothetical protein [Tanacetum cinerariifolium]
MKCVLGCDIFLDSSFSEEEGEQCGHVTQPKALIDLKKKKKRIPPSSKPKSPYKARVIFLKKQVRETQHAEVTVATADTTKSLVASKLAEEQGSQWSTSDDNVIDITPKDNEARDTDDLASLTGFETLDSNDETSIFVTKEHSTDNLNATSDELATISSKVDQLESQVTERISDEWKSSVPSLVTNTLKEQLSGLLSDALKDTLPQLIKDSIKSSVLEPIAEELPQKKLSKFLHNKMRKSIRLRVRTGMKEVRTNSLLVHPLWPPTPSIFKISGLCFTTWSLSSRQQKSLKRIMLRGRSRRKTIQRYQRILRYNELMFRGSKHLLKPEEQQKSVQEFTDQLFETTSSKFSLTPLKEPTPPRDFTKGKEVAIVEEQVNELVPYQEEGGSIPKISKIKSFITPEGTLSQEEFNNQIKEMKRSSDLKAEKEKPEQELRKIADQLPIIKISHVVNLNLIVHPNFRLRTLGFSEWLEAHALASKKTRKSNDMRLQSLRAKFQWVINQAKKLGLPPPPALVTFGMTEPDSSPRVVPIEGLVINKPKSRIFFMNRNTDIAFQRESEFHLAPTTQLIRIQNQIKVDSEIAKVMKGLYECKASESNIRRIRVKEIIKEVKDYLKTYSSAGMDIR